MDNLFTYVKFRGDISFKRQPFNENDAMVFAVLVAIDLEGCVFGKTPLKSAYKAFQEVGKKDERDDSMENKLELFKLCAESKRFENVLIENYVKDIDETEEKTFYAVTFWTGRFDAQVCYRGTDGSLLSWKENFNGLFSYPTPGQRDALSYLNKAIMRPFVRVNVIGHSKGANLAVFASMGVETGLMKKIKGVYSFDGPGFLEDISNKLSYLSIEDRIHAFIPESSVIGRLLEPPFEKTVVSASGKGLFQHDLFNWELLPTGVKNAEAVDLFSDSFSTKLNDWMKSIPIEERERVVNEMFSVFKNNGISHINDLMHIDIPHIVTLVKCVKDLSSENRNLLVMLLKELRAPH